MTTPEDAMTEHMESQIPDIAFEDMPEVSTDDLIRMLANEVAEMRAQMTAFVELVTVVKEQVEPTLTALQNHPMLRMLFGGDK